LDSSSVLINDTALFYMRSAARHRQHPTYPYSVCQKEASLFQVRGSTRSTPQGENDVLYPMTIIIQYIIE